MRFTGRRGPEENPKSGPRAPQDGPTGPQENPQGGSKMNTGLDSKTARRHTSDQGRADAPTRLPKGPTTTGLYVLRTCTPRSERNLLQGLVRDAVTLDDANVGRQLLKAFGIRCGREILGKPVEDFHDDGLRITGIRTDNELTWRCLAARNDVLELFAPKLLASIVNVV